MNKEIVPIKINELQKTILVLRNKRVMIDSDLAKIYGVTTRRLNEQVKRNINGSVKNFVFIQIQMMFKRRSICNHL